MDFQLRLSGMKEKKRILYCKNPLCQVNTPLSKNYNKRTLISVHCLFDQGSERQIFYICSECGFYDCSNFGNLLLSPQFDLKNYIIPNSYLDEFHKMIESPIHQKCVFCKFDMVFSHHDEPYRKSEIESREKELNLNITNNEKKRLEQEIKKLKNPQIPIFETARCTFKLFTNKPKRRNYIGYFCLACESIYFDPIFHEIDWEKISQSYKNEIFEDAKINPFRVWNKIQEEKQQNTKEYKKLKNEPTGPHNQVDKQKLETWQGFKLPKPPENQEITIKSLGLKHTLTGWDTLRPERFSLELKKLTLKKYLLAIEMFGSEEQKEQSKLSFYYGFNN